MDQYPHQIPYQNIARGTSTQGQVNMVVEFLELYLPSFSSWFTTKCFTKPNESKFTYELCRYLSKRKVHNSENKVYPFEFIPETPQKSVRRTDLGIHINTVDTDMDLIYCVEAKRLPTDRVGGHREKEYVIGNFGGINRFKQNLHGITDNEELIPDNAIIAYVQQLTFEHWYTQINNWIDYDTNWGKKELLQKIYFKEIGKLESEHIRLGGDIVRLTHFWVTFV